MTQPVPETRRLRTPSSAGSMIATRRADPSAQDVVEEGCLNSVVLAAACLAGTLALAVSVRGRP